MLALLVVGALAAGTTLVAEIHTVSRAFKDGRLNRPLRKMISLFLI